MSKAFVLLVGTLLFSGVAAAQEATPVVVQETAPITATAYGTINVRSLINEGTIITVELPNDFRSSTNPSGEFTIETGAQSSRLEEFLNVQSK